LIIPYLVPFSCHFNACVVALAVLGRLARPHGHSGMIAGPAQAKHSCCNARIAFQQLQQSSRCNTDAVRASSTQTFGAL